jgi:uncharacterized protein YidB (DUF937 family)
MVINTILASVMQGVLGGQAGGAQASPIAGVLAALMTPQQGQAAQAFGSGGLSDLLTQFRGAGYEQQVDSWVSTGPNKSIDPQAMETVFGREKLGAMASQAGVPQNELMAGLARMLPDVVNGLTPQGRLPAEGAGMNQMLASVLGGLMGGGGGTTGRGF